MLINADQHVVDMFHRVFDNLGTSPAFIPAGVYLPLILNADARKMKKGLITEAVQTPFS